MRLRNIIFSVLFIVLLPNSSYPVDFIAGAKSGLYMMGKFEISDKRSPNYSSFTTQTFSPKSGFSLDTRQLGLNIEPSIGYGADNGLIFTLGFRFQLLKTEYLDDFPGENQPLPDANDYLYGAFVSVLYAI